MIQCSVIITSYNQSDTISQTIESVLAQKCNFDFEIVIGDDNSSDDTRQICAEYQSRHPQKIKTVFHEENLGVGGNFAKCVIEARGKLIAICAADDYWHINSKLQLQKDFLDQNSDIGLIYTDYQKLNVKTGKIVEDFLRKTKAQIYEGPGLIKDFFYGKVPALTLTVMFRKELFDKYIPIDDYIKYRFPLEDWPTWLILSKFTNIGYLPISTGTYRYGNESITNPFHLEKLEKRLGQEQLMYKYLCELFPQDLVYNETNYLKYANHVLLNLAIKKRDYYSAKKYSMRMKELGSNEFKTNLTTSKFAFYSFSFLRKIKTNLCDR